MFDEQKKSPLRELEYDLHGPVASAILPIFAFTNAGLSLSGTSFDDVTHPVTLGVIFGLLIGKPFGILAFVGLGVGLRFIELPRGINWPHPQTRAARSRLSAPDECTRCGP